MRRLLDKFLWRNFIALSNFSFWVTRRFTHVGKLFFTLMCVTAIIGIDTRNALSYQLFSLSLVFFVVAILSSLFFRAKFTVSRQLPKYCSVGEKFSYQLDITSLSKIALHRISVLDVNKDPRPTFDEFHLCHEPKQSSSNIFDRFFRYPRWIWIINMNSLAHSSITDVPDINPRQSVSVAISILPIRRGMLNFSHAEIYQRDLMGLYRAKKVANNYQSVLILPKRYRIPEFQLPGRRQHNPGGVANAGSVGDTEEFVSLREYQPGDSIRAIHWKSWAKTNRPIVKQYQEEYFSRYGLILDTFGDEQFLPAFEEAVSVASSFVYSLHADDTLVDFMFVANKAYQLSMGRGINQTERILEVLASVSLQRENRFNLLYASLEQHVNVLSSAVIILLTLTPEREKLISLLQVNNIPYKVFLINTPQYNNEYVSPDDKNIIQLDVGNIEAGLAR